MISTPDKSLNSPAPKRYIFPVVMFVFAGIVLTIFTLQLNFDPSTYFFDKTLIILNLFDLFVVELLFIILLFKLLYNKYTLSRYLLYLLTFIFVTVYLIQIKSINEGGEFVSRLAIENVDHIYLFLNVKTIVIIFTFFISCMCFLYLVEKNYYIIENRNRIANFLLIFTVSAVLLVLNNNNWFYRDKIKYSDAFIDFELIHETSPLLAFYQVLFEQNGRSDKINTSFTRKELTEINKFGFHYNQKQKFPLVKEKIYTDPAPFPKVNSGRERPNVIVIFSEGLSARSIGAYGSRVTGITPNIDQFAQSSMVVHNYYNHTAATYRGLLGQLCSLFPINGGSGWQNMFDALKDTRYFSIAELFKVDNYETIFLDSHHKRHVSRVDEMIEKLGFMDVITGDELSSRYLDNEEPFLRNAFSDFQFFKGLIGYLKERNKSGKQKVPFFLGMYNFGTHAFLKPGVDTLTFGDGRNYALNNFHSFDSAFGLFWDYFLSSTYINNTIVILTADHCHYPEKAFVTSFNDQDYQGYFVDRVPYIVYDPTRIIPETYDARNATTLDFAPSLAHYLELANGKNPFLGTSMYEKSRKKYDNIGISYIPDKKDLFIIKDQKIQHLGNSNEYHNLSTLLSKFVMATQQAELANRIWSHTIKESSE